MPKKTAVNPDATEADPRFDPVAKAFARAPGFSLMESKTGGTRGLMLDGKSFGMSSHGRFIVKLSPARADQLIADGVGKAFSPSAGKVSKGWVDVTDAGADWVALAKEGHRYAIESSRSASRKKSAGKKPAGKKGA